MAFAILHETYLCLHGSRIKWRSGHDIDDSTGLPHGMDDGAGLPHTLTDVNMIWSVVNKC